MAKRADGQGAVYLRADGRWEAQLRLAGGGRKSVYGRTRREALGKLREARWAAVRGLPVSSRNPTLAAFLDRWLEVIRDRVRPSAYENYELNATGAERGRGKPPMRCTIRSVETGHLVRFRLAFSIAKRSRSTISRTPPAWASVQE
jgi:hypothetical protein